MPTKNSSRNSKSLIVRAILILFGLFLGLLLIPNLRWAVFGFSGKVHLVESYTSSDASFILSNLDKAHLQLDPDELENNDIRFIITTGSGGTFYGLKSEGEANLYLDRLDNDKTSKPSFKECKRLVLTSLPLQGFGVDEGDWYCVLTSKNRLARIHVAAIARIDCEIPCFEMVIEFDTWYFPTTFE